VAEKGLQELKDKLWSIVEREGRQFIDND
jgi:hypothetical protein